MASINDNLFTTLVNYANPPEVGCRMLTSMGPICAKFNERGLNALYFDDDPDHKGWVDSVFREAFLKWLSAFQQMTPATQWSSRTGWNRLPEIGMASAVGSAHW